MRYWIIIFICVIFIAVVCYMDKFTCAETNVPVEKKPQKKTETKPDTKPDTKPSTGSYVSVGEGLCKEILEEYLGRETYRVRPEWLKNDKTGRNLEIDIYEPISRIGIEYNGKQHYEISKDFTTNNEQLESIKYRDALKLRKCKEMNVKLIVVPYTVDSHIKDMKKRKEALREYILERIEPYPKI